MELTTHSNICTQDTETDCLALPCIILSNPSELCLTKQGEMILQCWQRGRQRNDHKLPFIYLSLQKNIRSVAILRFTSALLQFFERTKLVERFWVKFYSPAVVQIWVALLITVRILLITVFILSVRVYISSRSGFLL